MVVYCCTLIVMTGFEMENRYIVKNTMGQQVYFAAESTQIIRMRFLLINFLIKKVTVIRVSGAERHVPFPCQFSTISNARCCTSNVRFVARADCAHVPFKSWKSKGRTSPFLDSSRKSSTEHKTHYEISIICIQDTLAMNPCGTSMMPAT